MNAHVIIEPASPELQFLLACLRSHYNAASEAELRLAAAAFQDIERFLSLVEVHAVTPRVARPLNSLSGVPERLLAEIRQHALTIAQENLARTAELITIAGWMQSAGIPTIAYKGPVLAVELYGGVSEREFFDLDLLIDSSDLDRASKVLDECGYRPAEPFSASEQRSLLRFDCELNFVRGPHYVEIHWDIAPYQFGVHFPFRDLWQRHGSIAVSSTPLPALAPEDLLLVLAVHAAKHSWELLTWTCDILQLLSVHSDLDWDLVFELARRHRLRRILAITLAVARYVSNAPLPIRAEQFLAAEHGLTREVEIIQGSWAGKAMSDTRRHFFLVRTREHWLDRLRYAYRLLFTPGKKEWSVANLPAPMYLLVRLARVAAKLISQRRP